MLYSLATDPAEMDLYVNIGVPKETLKKPSQRIREVDLQRSIGVVADFDVKVGGFQTTEILQKFLEDLPLRPTMVVASGSGGLHAWWKLSDLGPMSTGLAKEIGEQWWAYLQNRAQEQHSACVDKIADTARMLRLPGTIHWARAGSAGVPTEVSLVYTDGPVHTVTAITRASAGAWEAHLHKRVRVREADRNLQTAAIDYATMIGGGRWAQRSVLAGLEEWFAETVSWTDILTPAGWNYVREDGYGRHEWGRPGRDEKSATVDWPDSPDMMSLLSSSHETNMLDLLDAGVPLTKFRVSLRLNFADNYEAMVLWCFERMKNGE